MRLRPAVVATIQYSRSVPRNSSSRRKFLGSCRVAQYLPCSFCEIVRSFLTAADRPLAPPRLGSKFTHEPSIVFNRCDDPLADGNAVGSFIGPVSTFCCSASRSRDLFAAATASISVG